MTSPTKLIPRPCTASFEAPPVHPGEVLLEEFLTPICISHTAFAVRLGVSRQRLNDLIHGRRGVTPDSALRLARMLGTSPEFWLTLRETWDLWHAAHGPDAKEIAALEPLPHDRLGALLQPA
jgi:antitoxin HigA-1